MLNLKYEVWEDCGDPTDQYLIAQFEDEESAVEFMEQQWQAIEQDTNNQTTMGVYLVAISHIARKEIWRNWHEALRPKGWQGE